MALTRKPAKNTPTASTLSEAETEQLIKGGALEPERKAAVEPTAKIKKSAGRPKKEIASEEEQIIPLQLRLEVQLVETIDAVIKKRIAKISRHAWLVEAISEKLQREQNS